MKSRDQRRQTAAERPATFRPFLMRAASGNLPTLYASPRSRPPTNGRRSTRSDYRDGVHEVSGDTRALSALVWQCPRTTGIGASSALSPAKAVRAGSVRFGAVGGCRAFLTSSLIASIRCWPPSGCDIAEGAQRDVVSTARRGVVGLRLTPCRHLPCGGCPAGGRTGNEGRKFLDERVVERLLSDEHA